MAILELECGKKIEFSKTLKHTDKTITVDDVLVHEDKGQIVFKAMMTPDGTVLTSMSQHDYNSHIDDNGVEYSVDGGNDAYTWSSGDGKEVYLHLYSDDSIENLRYVVGRSGYGSTGRGKWSCALLYQMSTSWVTASIEFTDLEYLKDIYGRELQYRLDNPRYDVLEDTEYFTSWHEAMEGSYSKIKSLL